MAENAERNMSELDISDKKKGKKTGGEGDASHLKELAPPPEFIEQRMQLWNKLKKEYDDFVAAQPHTSIKITLPDSKQVDAKAWETTPYDIAKGISQGLADSAVVAKVNGEVWDLDRPFEKDSTLQLVKFDSEEGQYVFWHSSAHILGETMERLYGGHLCYGPPIENEPTEGPTTAFANEENAAAAMNMPPVPARVTAAPVSEAVTAVLQAYSTRCFKSRKMVQYLCLKDGKYYFPDTDDDAWIVSSTDYPAIEALMKQIVKEKQPFERLEMKKEDLLEMFKYNTFKQRILNEKVDTPTTTVYRCGPLIDLCRGPHVQHTGKVKACMVTKNSSTYWEGKADMESLQRIYGISFPDTKQLKEWKKLQEEAAKRDHRKLGRDHELYFFHELSPGCCFFLPKGAHIYNTLIDFIRSEYRKRGFQEVVSPNIYNSKLWETSGHWQHYSENMFSFEVEKEKFALKPMNCPGHCLMFDHRPRSWKELPLRMADFGVLHRNELSGALSGLTRVRRFQQDDAHIFCMPEQIKEEIAGCLDFLKNVYEVFGFTFDLKLSTRPEKFLGEIEMWDRAEKQLAESLDEFGWKWELNPGDGAFYGPKIDITIKDALKRSHQCATIQLDFQLPIRFNLFYNSGEEGAEKKRPVMIHRAILGSLERMIAILTENFGGKWPFWLSPRQAAIIPVAPPFDEYALKVRQKIHDAGFMVDTDLDPTTTLNKKVRNNQLAQYNFILVVGEKELENGTVNVRTRDNKVHGEHSVEKVIEKFLNLKSSRCLDAEEKF